MQFRELPTIQEGEWDVGATHPMQTFAWGTIREKTGLKVVRFGGYENDTLVETYQMTLHRVPLLSYTIGYVPRSAVPSEEFLKYLKEYCQKYKIIFVKFEPNEAAATDVFLHPAERPSYLGGRPHGRDGLRVRSSDSKKHLSSLLTPSAHPLFYQWSRVIDLSKSLEDLKKDLDATTRYNVGLAERKGVVVSLDDTDRGFEDFYTLYSATSARQHFGGHSRIYHETIWKEFRKNNVAHILVARFSGQPLAACQLWLYKDTLYYTYAGSAMEHRNVKAMNALMWHVIMFGKEHGAQILDLWGILPPGVTDTRNPWAGFSDFKKGFGGEAVEMIGSYDLVVFPFLYTLYGFVFKIRKLV